MIVNTQKYFSAPKFSILFSLLITILMVWCTSCQWTGKSAAGEPPGTIAGDDWMEQSSRASFLSLNAEDYQGLSSRGSPIQWHPLLIPLRADSMLSDRDFVLGLPNALGSLEGVVPDAGQCALLNQSSTPTTADSNENMTSIVVNLLDPKSRPQTGVHGQLFFIHEHSSRAVRSVGFFDDDGLAQCRIPKGHWYISTGFGEARVHKVFSTGSGKEIRIQIRQHKRALLRIRPSRDTGLQYGDLIRIGRIRAQQPAPQESGQLPEVPIQIPDDLLRSTLSPSENFGVREYLFTSLILQRREFSISLEPGEYMIGVWRRGIVHRCAEKLIINTTDHALLACHPDMESSKLANNSVVSKSVIDNEQRKLNTLIFDGSFMPSRLIGQDSFRTWMIKSGATRMLRAGRSIDTQQQQIQFLLQPLMQEFSASGFQQPEGPFIGDFRLTQRPDTDEKMAKVTFARILTAQSGLNIESILARFFAGSTFSQTIPLAGITERGLLEGVVPLTFRTILNSSESRIFRTEGAETFVTNGSLIEWIDPLPANIGSPLKLGPQQHVRIKLTVPPEDTTENLGMFINGERVKQWNIDSALVKSSYRILEIEEKINLKSDFLLGFASWGQTYLPEFMYGLKKLPALAFTRIYCVDVNENGICDRQ